MTKQTDRAGWPIYERLLWLPWRARANAQRFEELWGDLSRYNTERHRGIIHTPEMQERMAVRQVEYDAVFSARASR